MQNQLIPFQFNNHQVRIVHMNGEPRFVAKDVAEALEYSWKGTLTIRHVPEEWRGVYSVQTPSGIQEVAVLSEAGMFFFVNRSDKPKALPFQKWVAGDVLPSIRKTGGYTAPSALPELTVPLVQHLALAEEAGALRDQVADLKDELLGLYRSKSPVRRVRVEVVEKVPVAAIELMLRYGIPREEVAAVSGRSRDCLRVHIHYARRAGRLQ